MNIYSNNDSVLVIFLLFVNLNDLKGSKNSKYFQYCDVVQMKDLIIVQLLILVLVDFRHRYNYQINY